MKARIISFLSTKLGAFITPFIAAGVAGLAAVIASKLPWMAPFLTDDNITAFVSAVVAIVIAWVNYSTNARNAKYLEPLQNVLNEVGKQYGLKPNPVDGVAGPKTLAHAAEVIYNSDPHILPSGVKPVNIAINKARIVARNGLKKN